MSERDHLYDFFRLRDYQGTLSDEDCLDLATDLLAAGWRKVATDQVVVSREEYRNLVTLQAAHFPLDFVGKGTELLTFVDDDPAPTEPGNG